MSLKQKTDTKGDTSDRRVDAGAGPRVYWWKERG